MKTIQESLRTDRHGLVVRIQAAITETQDAIDCDDCKEIIDWCSTIQSLTAELVASTMLDIRNRGD